LTKAIVFLCAGGIARSPAILCAEDPAEAEERRIPLLQQVFAQISSGMEVRRRGDSAYELFEKGRPVGTVEILDPAFVDGEDKAEP
jgi:hypothetical protein